MEDEAEEQAIPAPRSRGLHIKKRALKNKGLSISFDEKDLRYYLYKNPFYYHNIT